MQNLTRITRNPEVMGGKPCIRGMCVTVGTIVGLMASGHSQSEILEAYPYHIWKKLTFTKHLPMQHGVIDLNFS